MLDAQTERPTAIALGAVLLGIAVWAMNPYPVGVLHDDAVYVILARALATGQGYRYLNLPGAPFATHFPPGYPLFLSLLWRVMPSFPGNVLLFKFANVLLLIAAYVLLGRLIRARPGLSVRASWVAAFVAVASVPMLLVSTLVLSETLFLVAVIVGLLVAQRLVDATRTRDAVIAGAVFGLVTLVRTPGIALLGAAVVCLVLRRRFREAAIVAVACAVVIAPWQVWAARHSRDVPPVLQGAYGSYTGWLGDAVKRDGIRFLGKTLAETGRQAAAVTVDAITPTSSSVVRMLAGVCLTVLVIFGAQETWRRMPVLAAFLAFYLVVVLVWPAPPPRYIWGMWPLLVLIPASALIDILPRRRWVIGIAAVIPVLGYIKYNVAGYMHRDWLAIPKQGGTMLRPIVTGIRAHTPPGAVVAATAEAAVYLYTDRPTTPVYSFTVDEYFRGAEVARQSAAIGDILAAYPVNLVVASSPFQRAAVDQFAAAHPGMLALSDSFPGGVVYRVALPR